MALHGLIITHHTGPTFPQGGWQVRHLSPPVPLARSQNLMPNGELESMRYLFHSRMSMTFALTNHLSLQCTCDVPGSGEMCPSLANEIPLDPELPYPTSGQRVQAVCIAHISDARGELSGQWVVIRRLAGRGPTFQYLESVGAPASRWVSTPTVYTRTAALGKLALLIRREPDFAHKQFGTGLSFKETTCH